MSEQEQTVTLEEAASAAAQEMHQTVKTRYDSGWLMSIQRPMLIAVMVGCINIVLLAFMRRLMPELPQAYVYFVIAMGIAAAVIGCTSTAWLAQPGQRARRTLGYRMAELALLLVFTRLAVWITAGDWPTMREFFIRPLESLLSGAFLVALAVVTISWVFAVEMSRDLLDMSLKPDELRLLGEDRPREGGQPIASNRGVLLNSFVGRWVIGGILIVVLAAGARVSLAENGFFALGRQNVPATVVSSIIVYFLSGLILISQGRLAVLRARWTIEQTPDLSTVSRNWPFYAFGVVAVVGLLAALMPFGGTYYLALLVATLLSLLYSVFFFIFQLISLIFLALLSLLPFSNRENAAPQQRSQPMAPPPVAPPSEFLEWAGGAIFWMIALLIVGYLAFVYFTDKGGNLRWLRWLLEMLQLRWLALRRGFTQWQAGRIRTRSGDDDEGPKGSFWRHLWPRRGPEAVDARIRYLYFSLLDAADDAGIARRRAETPSRYGPRLNKALSTQGENENTQGVNALTGAFVDVRYAHRTHSDASLSTLEAQWQLLRTQLRRYKAADTQISADAAGTPPDDTTADRAGNMEDSPDLPG